MFLTSYLRAKEKPRNQFKKLVHFVLLNLEDDLDMMLVWKSPGMKYILNIVFWLRQVLKEC